MRVFGMSLVFLGLCVFAWGLRYKLSLYDPPHSLSHHMPEAKLLTGKERPRLPAIEAGQQGAAGASLAFSGLTLALVFLFVSTGSPTLTRWASRPAAAIPMSLRCAGTAHFTRPPPILL